MTTKLDGVVIDDVVPDGAPREKWDTFTVESMMRKQLEEEAVARVTVRVKKMMQQQYGLAAQAWLRNNSQYVESVAKFTWIAIHEELER